MNPAFRFARGGKVYKELGADEAHQIAGYIRTGIISANDDYWMPGMADWKKVYTREWNFPKPADDVSTPKPPPANPVRPTTTPTPAAHTAQSTAKSSATSKPEEAYECQTCMKGFNCPAKATSGYSGIGLAAIFFIIGAVLIRISGPLYVESTIRHLFDDVRYGFDFTSILYAIICIIAVGLLLMSLFELISAAVTHGIYRSNPERCPHCKSSTFVKRG